MQVFAPQHNWPWAGVIVSIMHANYLCFKELLTEWDHGPNWAKRGGERGWAEECFQADLTRYLDLSSKSREIIENLRREIRHLYEVFVWSRRIKLHLEVLMVLFEFEDFGIFFLLFRPINFHFERFFFSLRTFEESQFSGLACFQTGLRLFPIQVSFKENLTVRRADV